MKELVRHTRTSQSTSRWALGAGALAALAAAAIATSSNDPTGNTRTPTPARTSCIHSADDLSLAFEEVAEAIHPSVVSIRSVSKLAHPNIQVLPGPFGDLFGHGSPRQNQRSVPDLLQQGLGSGFVLSADGYVLTNSHVVRNADEVTVTLADESTHVASVVGTDPKTDVAVLRIKAENLTPAPLGNNESLRVGSWVAAVGSPFGLSSTMTAGIVSAVGRSHMGLTEYDDFIQTDAAINPGNSGGPLVNLSGEVVGMNTAIFSRTGGSMGIGFAIPINLARTIAGSLIDDGHVERGLLGVVIQDLDAGLASSFGYQGTDGALVSDVPQGGPADEAGLRRGDIIVEFDGQPIDDVVQLKMRTAGTTPGKVVVVAYVRNGERRQAEVRIGELDSGSATAGPASEEPQGMGLTLEDITPRLAQRLELSQDVGGVLVTKVDPFSPAARAGIRLNDVITEVQGRSVESIADFQEAIQGVDLTEGVRLTLLTQGRSRFVYLRKDV